MVTVGILALQGDFAEHKQMIEQLGAQAVEVKHARQLAHIDGLVIPGGESTTIAKLTVESGKQDDIFDAIKDAAISGMPVFGTCMGTIFLAQEIEGSSQGRLALMDICVRRNAFGPQKFSRQQMLDVPVLGDEPFPVVFIRGPLITGCGQGVQALAAVEEGIVMARQDNLLAAAFHPELTPDTRVHRYFIDMVEQHKAQALGLADGQAKARARHGEPRNAAAGQAARGFGHAPEKGHAGKATCVSAT